MRAHPQHHVAPGLLVEGTRTAPRRTGPSPRANNHSINQPIDHQAISQSVNQSINQSISPASKGKASKRSINQSIHQSSKQASKQASKQRQSKQATRRRATGRAQTHAAHLLDESPPLTRVIWHRNTLPSSASSKRDNQGRKGLVLEAENQADIFSVATPVRLYNHVALVSPPPKLLLSLSFLC